VALGLLGALIPATTLARTNSSWNVTGTYNVNVTYLATNYPETLALTQSGMSVITGTSVGPPCSPACTLFTITSGSVVGNNINFATATPFTINFTGVIAPDGTMAGSWADGADGLGRVGTWATTSGTATSVKGNASQKWTLYYYVGDNGPYTATADNPHAGTIAQFPFTATPDQALLMSAMAGYLKNGNLLGKTVTATFGITAPAGTTFVGYDTGCGYPTANPPTVRFYFHQPGSSNFGTDDSNFWWSNPVSISLAHLFALGPNGTTLSVSIDPANWSDRAGGFGNADAAHLAAFTASASNVTEIGLSFGSGCTFAFGDGSNPAGALFNLMKFSTH